MLGLSVTFAGYCLSLALTMYVVQVAGMNRTYGFRLGLFRY